MSETWAEGATSSFADQPAANDTLTAGDLLRRAREAAGLHVAALAVSLKVPVRKLEALEENRWDLLPDAVFVRGLASSVCRSLKIDPQPVLDRLPQTAAPRLVRDGDGINTPFRAPSDGAAPSLLDQLNKPVYLAVFALLLGALVLILVPVTQHADSAPAEAAIAPKPPADPVVAAQVAVRVPVANDVKPTVVEPVLLPAPQVSAAVAEAAPSAATPLPVVVTPQPPAPSTTSASIAAAPVVTPAATAQAASSAASAAAAGIIVFHTTGSSWIEVTDAKGVVAVRKLLTPGESAGASGALPLQVTIGRVDATEVQVRGKPFDLKSVSRDNVARFEVK
jgi:cytoskeleton protein RodZ